MSTSSALSAAFHAAWIRMDCMPFGSNHSHYLLTKIWYSRALHQQVHLQIFESCANGALLMCDRWTVRKIDDYNAQAAACPAIYCLEHSVRLKLL